MDAATQPDDMLYVGGAEALPAARAFCAWLNDADVDAGARLRAVQNAFVVALANSRLCAAPLIENLESLRVLIAIQPEVLNYVLVGGDAPDLDNLAPAFALVNNTLFEKVAA